MTLIANADITITALGPGIGAELAGIDLRQPIAAEVKEMIMRAWTDHLVLRIRAQQGMSTRQLIEFSKIFGELDRAPITTVGAGKPFIAEHPEITAISNIVVDGKPIGGLGSYEAEWHTDMSYKDETPSASILYSIEVPPSGGDTCFSSMYAAYEALPADLKQRIAGLKCVHDASRNSAGVLRKGYKEVADPRETVGALHPLVRTHPVTGRKALFLGRRLNAYIPGLTLEASEALLDELWAHATRPDFVWVQQWRVGDVIIWDNRCTMHRRDAFDPATRRLMHRTQVRGDRPY